MRTESAKQRERGVTLIEMVVFIVVIAVSLTVFVQALNYFHTRSVDPLVNLRAVECAQAALDRVLARKFDENTPTGGIPACSSAEEGSVLCAGISSDADLDDVGDFNGYSDTSLDNCTVTITVVEAGSDLGIPNNQARLVTVQAQSSGGGEAVLSSYRTNF